MASDDPVGAPKQPARAWLEQFLARLRPRHRGDDVIAASVGEGARGVAVGKNIVQVGSVVVPVLPAVALLIVCMLVAAGIIWRRVVPAKMPMGRFNVAVAEFGEMDRNGRIQRSDDGRKLSEWMFHELEEELEAIYLNKNTHELLKQRPLVWHDSMGMTRKRGSIGVVAIGVVASDEQAIDEQAKALAKTLNARMVIYGNFVAGETEGSFTPKFYIAEVNDEAVEIVGTHQLGSPVDLELPIDPADQRAEEDLRLKLGTQTDILTWFNRGLVADLIGDHATALDVFKRAKVALEPNWPETDGKKQGLEILYYFIGRQALFLSSETKNADEAEGWLVEAEAAYTTAVELNPVYARARIGLGGVAYERAQRLPPELRLETGDLDQAVAEYSLAVEQGGKSPGAQIALKGRLGLGFSYRLRGEAYLHQGEHDLALADFDAAMELIEGALKELEPTQKRLIALGNLALGAAHQGKAYLQEHVTIDPAGATASYTGADRAYSACVEQADIKDRSLQQTRNLCKSYKDLVKTALTSLGGIAP